MLSRVLLEPVLVLEEYPTCVPGSHFEFYKKTDILTN